MCDDGIVLGLAEVCCGCGRTDCAAHYGCFAVCGSSDSITACVWFSSGCNSNASSFCVLFAYVTQVCFRVVLLLFCMDLQLQLMRARACIGAKQQVMLCIGVIQDVMKKAAAGAMILCKYLVISRPHCALC